MSGNEGPFDELAVVVQLLLDVTVDHSRLRLFDRDDKDYKCLY